MDVLQSAQEGILLLINIAVCLVNCLLKMFGCIFDDDTERNRDDVTDLLQGWWAVHHCSRNKVCDPEDEDPSVPATTRITLFFV